MVIEPKTRALQALLDGVIDYAGLFPPARLSLETAARYFADYLGGADRWMLRSFVCPAARLAELAVLLETIQPAQEVSVTVLGAVSGVDTWREDLRAAMDAADRFDRSLQGFGVSVQSFELKIDSRIASEAAELEKALAHLAEAARSRATADWFIECVPAVEQPGSVALTAARHRDRSGHGHLGLKIRTGGVTSSEVPAASAVARFICACRDHKVPFKATAGLHHPLYHWNEGVRAEMHGFLNTFCGAIVAAVHDLDERSLAELLVASDASHLTWTNDGFMFGSYRASVDDIRHIRNTLAISFGSCSFDEPREDLLSLGLATSKK